jgi:H+/gluconate symporter-like permease
MALPLALTEFLLTASIAVIRGRTTVAILGAAEASRALQATVVVAISEEEGREGY